MRFSLIHVVKFIKVRNLILFDRKRKKTKRVNHRPQLHQVGHVRIVNEEIDTLHLIYFSLLKILMLGLSFIITLLKSKLIFIEFMNVENSISDHAFHVLCRLKIYKNFLQYFGGFFCCC